MKVGMIFRVAFRNIGRNRKRSVLACVSVGVAVMSIVVMQGLVDGMMDNIVRNSTKNDTGHVKIASKEYFEDIESMRVDYLIEDVDKVVEVIDSISELRGRVDIITYRFRFPLLIDFKGNNKVGICVGGDVEKEKKLFMLDRSLVEGRYLSGGVFEEKGIRYREVILGKKVAEVLGISVGDSFSVLIQGSDLGIRIPRFKVVGIFNTGINLLDDNLLMISLDDAREILGAGNGVQEIVIMLKNYNDAKFVAEKINKVLVSNGFDTIKAVDWQSSGSFVANLQNVLMIYGVIYFIVALLGAFIIMSIMMMVVLERRREIGILKAMGMNKVEIVGLFTIEGTILGSIGAVVGSLIGVLISIPLSIWGIDFSSSLSSMNFPMDNVVKWMITVGGVFGAMVLGIFVSALVSVIPSTHAGNMKPVDAIKSI